MEKKLKELLEKRIKEQKEKLNARIYDYPDKTRYENDIELLTKLKIALFGEFF